MHNRIFRKFNSIPTNHQASFVDVTSVAMDQGFPFRTYASRSLLMEYTLPGVWGDDDGSLFTGSMIDDILEAISGRLPCVSVSFGTSFAVEFEFMAEHRRQRTVRILKLRALIGPYMDQEVYLCIVPEQQLDCEVPRDSAAF